MFPAIRDRVLQLAGVWLSAGACLSSYGLPPGTRGWETIPGVIRNDGLDSFRVEVDAGGPVKAVTLRSLSDQLSAPAPLPLVLRDDGVLPDRVAGDHVHTAGPFVYRVGATTPSHYMGDPGSPAGLTAVQVGAIDLKDMADVTTSFLVGPSVGLLDPSTPTAQARTVSTELTVSAHLANARVSGWGAQASLRGLSADGATEVAQRFYSHLPDACDFLVVISTNRLESDAAVNAENFVVGQHLSVQVNYTGTGHAQMDHSASFGSGGRLLGLVVLDAYDRGLYSANLTHELLHQWGGSLDPAFGLNDSTGHYNPRSSVASLLGGQRWIPNLDGSYTLDCVEGRNGAHEASPLDKYLMGLIALDQLPNLLTYSDTSPLPLFRCGTRFNDVTRSISPAAIQSTHGAREPGPAESQRRFRIGFVAETRGRLLTPTELTYYEILATGYTRALAEGEAPPYVGFNWAPISGFFGTGVSWSSAIHSGDLNGDGRVDDLDVGVFEGCSTGPGISYQSVWPPDCELTPDETGTLPADLDADRDVDQADFGVLQGLMTGP